MPNTNWTDALFKNGIEQNYNLSVSGASDKGNYFISGIYNKEKGVYIDNSSELVGARMNADLKINKRIKIGEQLYIWQRTTNPNAESTPNPPFRTLPIMAIYDTSNVRGSWGKSPAGFGGTNPVGGELTYYALIRNFTLQANAFAEVNLPFHLLFRATVGYTAANQTINAFRATYDFGTIQGNESSLEKSYSGFRGLQNNYTLTYDQNFGDHHVVALIGYEQITDKGNYIKARQTNQAIEQPSYTFFQTSNSISTVEGNFDENGLQKSQFARLNYDFAGKYLLSGSIRRDGNFKKFGPGNQYGIFPTISAAWKLSEERFIKAAMPSLSLLKIRGSYGVLGNDNIPDYIFLSTYNRVGAQNFTTNGTRNLGYSLTNIPNRNIKWESIIQSDIAIDGELMNGKIFFTVDWYNKKTNDMLYGLPIPSSSGITSVFFTNIGAVSNKGLEFSAGYNGKKSNLNYRISANAAFNKNKVLNLDNINKNPINSGSNDISGGYGVMTGQSISRTEVGHSFGEFYGFKSIGIYQSDADVTKYPHFDGATPKPGDLRYVDVNNDGKLNDDDRIFIGNPNPNLVYGLNIDLNWKGIDLALLFNGVAGVDVFNGVSPYAQYLFSDGNTTSEVFNASYLGSNKLTNQPAIGHKDNAGTFVSDPYRNYSRVSSNFIEKGDYLKLKNLQVGYTFKQGMFKNIGMRTARLFFMANNVFTITRYSGLDPEILGSVTNRGIDVPNFYPHARTYSFGIDVNF